MNSKAKGTRVEHKVRDYFRDRGFIAIRPGASLGAADLIVLKAGRTPKFVQVKGNTGSPWMNFRAAERKELVSEAAKAGALPVLAHWPARGELKFYGPGDWPNQTCP